MIINKVSFENIEKQANYLLHKYKVVDPGTPVHDIVEKEGLRLISYDLGESVSGVLLIKDRKGTIGYNPSDSKVRRRFTIAHELGHYFLHWKHLQNSKDDDIFVDKDFIIKFRFLSSTYDETEIIQEQEANAFAAALLMPESSLKNEFSKNDYSSLSESQVIEALAKTFEVSIAAMTFRLSNLNFFF